MFKPQIKYAHNARRRDLFAISGSYGRWMSESYIWSISTRIGCTLMVLGHFSNDLMGFLEQICLVSVRHISRVLCSLNKYVMFVIVIRLMTTHPEPIIYINLYISCR